MQYVPQKRGLRRAVGACLALCAFAVPAVAGATAAERPGSSPAPQRFNNTGLFDGLGGHPAEFVRVLIALGGDPLGAAARDPDYRFDLASRLTSAEQRILAHDPTAAARLARRQERQRELALASLNSAAARNNAAQLHLERAIEELGGRVLERHIVGNAVTARVPSRAVEALARRADVASIAPAPRYEPLGLGAMSAYYGASSFWSAGYTGGTGSSDTNPADLAIADDKVQGDHPAFAGITFQRPPGQGVGTACGTSASGCTHGTAIASAAISRGASGCALCAPADANEKGVAPGIDTVLEAEEGTVPIDPGAWMLGLPSFGQPGASDAAEVMNGSYGSFYAGEDDHLSLRIGDSYSAYGVLWVFAAGNDGPAQSVNSPSIAYNAISVGAVDRQGDQDPANDQVASFSSRGPTPAGRKKPELVAEGIPSQYAERRWAQLDQLWNSGDSGTSFAAPQLAAGATLLAGSGVTDPLAIKGILINSARLGRASPAQAMGTQSGWQPDWGWGMLDLTAALAQRLNFAGGSVPGGSARFYRSTVAQGDRATLTWNRRTAGCVGPGCMPEGMTLTNLDLEQVDETSGAVEAVSDSGIDNVEQLRAPAGGTGSVLYKVKAASQVDGLPGEPFALAAKNPLIPVASPQPTAAVSLSAGQVEPGQDVTVTATASNPSPDLEAEAAQVTLQLPTGVELVAGEPTQALGTLEKEGQPGDTASASWTVRATSDGDKQIVVATSATKYGETFSSQGVATLTVQSPPAPPPPPAPVAPPPAVVAPPPPAGPGPVVKVSPLLRIRGAKLTATALRVSGTVRHAATGRVTVSYAVRARGRLVQVRRRVAISGGRFRATLRLPARAAPHGKLLARYGGDAFHFSESARRSLRR